MSNKPNSIYVGIIPQNNGVNNSCKWYKPYRSPYFNLRLVIFALLLLLSAFHAQAQTDETDEDSVSEKKNTLHEAPFTYYRIGLDVSKIAASLAQKKYKVMEFQLDVHYKKDLYLALEFGGGNSTVENDFLNYKSSNGFLRIGMDKTFFNGNFKGDFDNAFVGVRYGVGFIQRSKGTYFIEDNVWGNSNGNIEKASFIAHWLELDGGFRLEIMKHIFAGWNIRFKTMLNPKKFEQLPPSYIAGFGKGDKNTAFGYNFYVLFGFGKRSVERPDKN